MRTSAVRGIRLALVVLISTLSLAAQAKLERVPLPTTETKKTAMESSSDGPVIKMRYRAPASASEHKNRTALRVAPLESTRNKTMLAGFKVKEVQPGSVYFEMDLREGDIVTHLNGKRLTKLEDLKMLEAFARQGGKIELKIKRDGQLYAMNMFHMPTIF